MRGDIIVGIIIRDIVMPESCVKCPLAYWGNMKTLMGCNIGKRYPNKDDDFWELPRPSWCPIDEIQPHGRLIDADVLYSLIDNGYDLNFDEVPETKRELLRMITESPTIIEGNKKLTRT